MRINFQNLGFKPIKLNNNNNQMLRVKNLDKDTFVKSNNINNVSFGAKMCATTSFEIKDVKNLHCPSCGLIMLNEEQRKAFIEDVSNARGQKLAEKLEKYEDETVFFDEADKTRSKKLTIYRPQKQKVVDIIKELALQHPQMDLRELFELKASQVIDELIKNQLKIVCELEEYISNSENDEEEKNAIFDIIEIYKKQIKGESEERFARARFIYAVLNQISDEKTKNEVNKIMSKLPQSKNDINSFFVNYNDISSRKIASKFVYESAPSADHLLAKSKGGLNITSNYACICADCNSFKGNKPFEEWIDTVENPEEKLQYYLFEVKDAIDRGELSCEYEIYIDEMIEKIYKLSKGKIYLKSPYLSDDENKNAIIAKRKEQINKSKDYVNELKEKRNILLEKIDNLTTHPYYQAKYNHNGDLNFWENIDNEIEDMRDIIADIEEFSENIKELKTKLLDEDKLKRRKTELLERNKQLRSENLEISNKKSFNPKDNSKFHELERIEELMAQAQLMHEALGYSQDRQEIIRIAIETLCEKSSKLLEYDNVKFKVNEKRIEDNIEELKAIKKKTSEIATNKDLIAFWEGKILRATQGLSYEEYIQQYDNLLNQREIIKKIDDIQTLREQIDSLDDLIEYNSAILSQLGSYISMPNSKFVALLNRIY